MPGSVSFIPALFYELGHKSRPTSLVARADSCPVIAVKILVKLYEVTPVRVGLKFIQAAINRSASRFISNENPGESPRDVGCDFAKIGHSARSERIFDCDIICKEVMKLLQ
jgi:hypothetical protein